MDSTFLNLSFALLGLVVAIFALIVGMFAYIVKISAHLARHDQQFITLEKNIDQRFFFMDSKFEQRFSDMDSKFEQRFSDMDSKFDQRLTFFGERLNNIEKSIERLPCDHHRDMIEDTRMIAMGAGSNSSSPGIKDSVLGAHSPLSPTEAGWKVIKALNMEEMLARNWQTVKEDLTKANPQLPYMIHIRAVGTSAVYPKTYLPQADIDRIGMYAYEKGVDMKPYLQLFGVLARDRYLKEKGLTS